MLSPNHHESPLVCEMRSVCIETSEDPISGAANVAAVRVREPAVPVLNHQPALPAAAPNDLFQVRPLQCEETGAGPLAVQGRAGGCNGAAGQEGGGADYSSSPEVLVVAGLEPLRDREVIRNSQHRVGFDGLDEPAGEKPGPDQQGGRYSDDYGTKTLLLSGKDQCDNAGKHGEENSHQPYRGS